MGENFEADPRFPNLLNTNFRKDGAARRVLRLQQNLGYDVNMIGCCYGVASVAVFAQLYHLMPDLEKDLAIISNMSTSPEDIAWYRRFLASTPTTPQAREAQQNLGYALARLEQIHTCFMLSKHRQLFDSQGPEIRGQTSNINEAAALYAPKNLQDENRIVETHRVAHTYTKNEFLESLKLLKLGALTDPVGIILIGKDHGVSIIYDPAKQSWTFVDYAAPQMVMHNLGLEEAANLVWESITKKGEDSYAIGTQVITTRKNQATVNSEFADWNQFHMKNKNEKKEKRTGKITSAVKNLFKRKTELTETEIDIVIRSTTMGQLDQFKLLLENSNPKNKSLVATIALATASVEGQLEIAKYAIKNGAIVNEMAENGRSILHAAAEHGNTAIVTLLLNHGAKINVQDDHGMTPLHLAARYTHRT